ncbi:hypothetical protein K438DRAFT_1956436 [Mycena galopus ATCC 62051]|nr:hypothetical protein K438DRAFT_1956436 [Mycena galopus ATCC 62051]
MVGSVIEVVINLVLVLYGQGRRGGYYAIFRHIANEAKELDKVRAELAAANKQLLLKHNWELLDDEDENIEAPAAKKSSSKRTILISDSEEELDLFGVDDHNLHSRIVEATTFDHLKLIIAKYDEELAGVDFTALEASVGNPV